MTPMDGWRRMVAMPFSSPTAIPAITTLPGAMARQIAKSGWWDRLIGPGKAIDTERFLVISSNVLGSCYGTTGPGSVNPATGKPYGPEFPDITMRDIVVAQREFLIRLGVTHLVAVAGPSLGGRQAFQWAVTYPDFMDGIVAVASSPKGLGKR